MRLRRATAWLLASVVALFAGGEASLRLIGAVDLPLYRADRLLGYVPAPNQSGAVLRRYTFAFNALGMGVAQPFVPAPHSLLLIGDSIVHGGAKIPQEHRLGPLLADAAGRQVWPIGAQSWALENELRYIRSTPRVLALPAIVFLTNAGDLGLPSTWRSEITHPTHAPLSALVYVVRRKLIGVPGAPDAPPDPTYWRGDLAWLLAHFRGEVTFVLYPKRSEIAAGRAPFAPLLAAVDGNPHVRICDIAGVDDWSTGDYLDEIHPTGDGLRRVAATIAACLGRDGRRRPA